MRQFFDFLHFLLLFGLVIASFLGLLLGGIEAKSRGTCGYTSIASYFPPHWISCELFETRWPEDAP
jgi:hypothetical protein